MKKVWEIASMIIGAFFIAVGSNLFIIPHQILSSGLNGLAMITGYFTNWNIGLLYLIFNAPILVAGWFILGKRFIFNSMVSVVAVTWFMQLLPVYQFNDTPILGAVFGGCLIGFGAGISLRMGGSSGGFDIVASIISRYRDIQLGMMIVGLNGFIIIALGYMKDNWDLALYSMLSVFITGKVMDVIHISHIKVTAFIITNETELMLEKLLGLPRGVTIIKTRGAYSEVEKDMLMTVTTRYELAELQNIIKSVDKKAFVNIVETVGVMGAFRRRKP
ncbi:YitT family protein [Paenibacillus sp. GCM10027629]|uniref:YitT family protein n=1 Tax=Paenibacillus sp. GCM10027629 TaxID=3273414 RepID=UPI0036313634